MVKPTWRTFQILDVLDHKQAFFRPPFDNQTQTYQGNCIGKTRLAYLYSVVLNPDTNPLFLPTS